MTNPTSAFGWQMPTSTDLVTDLPADFEVFGQAVDTSLADLKGGTTGQVLSKATNADMDFTWVTTDDANAIQNSIVDAKGDLIAASANDTPARLAVGNNGETLVADSSTATGLRYQVPVNVNPILNSNFAIAQRGTSFALSVAQQYTLDRWYAATSNTATYSRQVTGDTTNLPFIQYCMRVQRNSGQTGTSSLVLHQPMETVNSIPYAGKTVTLSFYARKGANFSEASSQLTVFLIAGTGTDQNFSLAGYTGQTLPINAQKATLTTTWQRFTYTATIGSTVTELTPYVEYVPTGTAGAADFFEITGFQLEVGSVATPYKPNGATFQGELAACQRYYWRATAQTNYSNICFAMGATSTVVQFIMNHPVQMRTNPTSIDYLNLAAYDGSTVYSAYSSIGLNTATLLTVSGNLNFASGITAGKLYQILSNNTTNSYLGISAEL